MMPTRTTHDHVVLAHGGGGELMGRLIREHILPRIGNPWLAVLTDGAVVPWGGGEVVFTTDSYVVTPLEFPGGDIGRLAVAGTVNDLAVMGAEPVALSLGLILEEGLPLAVLDRVLDSLAATAREAGVAIATGDTKVIERRTAGGDAAAQMFINTSGVGRRRPGLNLDVARIAPGDAVLVTGPLAEHGLAIMSVRAGLEFESTLRSDVAPLGGLLGAVFATGADVRFVRDATRGGAAGVLADIVAGCGHSVEIDERAIPLSPTGRHAAEMLGLDPLAVANEGKCVLVTAAADAERVLALYKERITGERQHEISAS